MINLCYFPFDIGIRGALLDSDEQQCPGCNEKETSPTDLIPNRFLRTAVNAFKNETGYSKPSKMPEKVVEPVKMSPRKEAQAAAAAERKSLSMDELPEDLFPHSPVRRQDNEEEAEPDPADTKGNFFNYIKPINFKEYKRLAGFSRFVRFQRWLNPLPLCLSR